MHRPGGRRGDAWRDCELGRERRDGHGGTLHQRCVQAFFQQRRKRLGCWPGHDYGGAPATRIGGRGGRLGRETTLSTHCPSTGPRDPLVRVCLGTAQSMFYDHPVFDQPLNAWDVGKVLRMNVRLASEGAALAPCSLAPCAAPLPPPSSKLVCAAARHSTCSDRPLPSINRSTPGMSARST